MTTKIPFTPLCGGCEATWTVELAYQFPGRQALDQAVVTEGGDRCRERARAVGVGERGLDELVTRIVDVRRDANGVGVDGDACLIKVPGRIVNVFAARTRGVEGGTGGDRQ